MSRSAVNLWPVCCRSWSVCFQRCPVGCSRKRLSFYCRYWSVCCQGWSACCLLVHWFTLPPMLVCLLSTLVSLQTNWSVFCPRWPVCCQHWSVHCQSSPSKLVILLSMLVSLLSMLVILLSTLVSLLSSLVARGGVLSSLLPLTLPTA